MVAEMNTLTDKRRAQICLASLNAATPLVKVMDEQGLAKITLLLDGSCCDVQIAEMNPLTDKRRAQICLASLNAAMPLVKVMAEHGLAKITLLLDGSCCDVEITEKKEPQQKESSNG